jgi:pyruvate-formate lyase-activating enzyme
VRRPRRSQVLIVEPGAAQAHVFSAFAKLPLLGPLYLGTLLEQAGFRAKVVSENLLGRSLGAADLDADFLLLSCLTPTVERGYELADLFKRRNPQGKVLMGGPHVSFMSEEALRHADWVVAGEAEEVVVDLLRNGCESGVVQGRPVEDLDRLPEIDWSLLVGAGRLALHPFMFSRGCPFGCNFCSVTSMFGRRYRAMSVERVLAELARPFAPASAFFYDDNFAAHRARTHAILDGLLARNRRVDFVAQVRADVTRDEELLSKMARVGCARVYVGFESVDDGSLREMNKGQTGEDVRRSIRLFHRHGIHVHGMFMFGADAEGPESIRAAAELVRQQRVDSVQYMVMTPFPGTELFRRLEGEDRLLHRVWRYYDGAHVVIRPKRFTPSQLQRLALGCYGEYYGLRQALGTGLEAAAASVGRAFGVAPERWGAPTLTNAFLKVVGTQIVRRWLGQNADYLRYLAGMGASAAKVAEGGPAATATPPPGYAGASAGRLSSTHSP